MRGGKLTGDSSYSTSISSSSDYSGYLAGQSGDFQQNVDRNNSNISGEGNNVDMSQFKGLIPPGAYAGGRRRRRRMRGGMGSVSDDSEAAASDVKVNEEEVKTGLDDAQMGGRRRRRRMRGGDDMPMTTPDNDLKPMTAMNPDTVMPMEGGRRRRKMRGGMYDPPMGPDSTPTSGGTRQRRRGGGVIATAALPFGLFGLQKYFQGSRRSENGTRRRTRRRRA
jgi:hypothetical protein